MSCLGNIENDIGRDRDVTHPAALLCYHPKYFHTYTYNHIHSYIYKYIYIHRERERGIYIYIYNINNIYIARTSTHAVAPHHYLPPYIYTYIHIHTYIYIYIKKYVYSMLYAHNIYTVCFTGLFCKRDIYTHRMINRPAPPLFIAIFYSPFLEMKRHKHLRMT